MFSKSKSLKSSNNSSSNLLDIELSIAIICLSHSENISKQLAENMISQKNDINGMYRNTIDNILYIILPRWPNFPRVLPNTTVIDAIVINVDMIEEMNKYENYLRSKERVHLVIFWSDSQEVKSVCSTFKNGKFLPKKEFTPEQITKYILDQTKTFNKQVKNIFETLYSNKNCFSLF